MEQIQKTKLSIEFAGNGVIVRDEDGASTLAITKYTKKTDDYGYDVDRTAEYQLIGRRISDWLREEADFGDDFFSFDIEIKARPKHPVEPSVE